MTDPTPLGANAPSSNSQADSLELGGTKAAVNDCEHYWGSTHEPGHIVYWVRTCMICRAVDWDDLDREIRKAVNELLQAATASCENRTYD